MAKQYLHTISSSKGTQTGLPIHLNTGDFRDDLGGDYLRRYLELNQDLLQNPRVSKIEIRVTYNK
ncbi:MAG TPA: hypothetical protein VMC80_00530 [Patescibacteria group bacterium]|nr:hypothetical protein [Patescibacteria group bacterium]